MNLIKFEGVNIVYAEDQPEYNPLPAFKVPNDPQGRIICCWQLTWKERLKVLFRGQIWHHILAFNNALQPQLLEVDRPEQLPPLPSREPKEE